MIVLLVYVDDILPTGNDQRQLLKVITMLDQQFPLKTLGSLSYFIRFEAYRDSTSIYLSQRKYITDLLERVNMSNAKSCPTPTCPGIKLSREDSPVFEQPTVYRSIIGALQYLTLTRPDISFAVNKLSQFLQAPTNDHWKACKRVLRYLRGTTEYGLHFSPAKQLFLEGVADADWASSTDDRKSTSSYCIYFGGNLIAWSSKKQKVVALSSAESEYRSIA